MGRLNYTNVGSQMYHVWEQNTNAIPAKGRGSQAGPDSEQRLGKSGVRAFESEG